MYLYASTPDLLAQQQQNYDQIYGRANQENRDSYQNQQARQIELALRQQAADEAARRSDIADNNFVANRDFNAYQNALDRASREKNVKLQYESTHQDRTDALNQRQYEKAQNLAAAGMLPDTKDEIKRMFGVSDNDADTLAQINGAKKLTLVANAFQQRARTGNFLQPEEVKNFLSEKSPVYSKAIDIVNEGLKPFEMEYQGASKAAEKGNLASRISAISDTLKSNPTPVSDNPYSWYNPMSWLPVAAAARAAGSYFNGASQKQPDNSWMDRAGTIVNSLRDDKSGRVQFDEATGRFVPAFANPRLQPAAPVSAPQAQPQSAPNYQPAPANPSDRSPNTVYLTPKGPLLWSGRGWIVPSSN